MQLHPYGNSGLEVSALGFGAGHIGSSQMSEDEAGTLLNRALDLGITLIDTARGYGLSEERIGRHLSWRRGEFVLSSKGGYGVEDVPDWSAECILRGVEQALERLRTDFIDIFHLHSCPRETLERAELWDALEEVRQRGQVRTVAYSGENADLACALEHTPVGGIQTSVNLFDQRSLSDHLPLALQKGIGVIAKRPVANAPWRFLERPTGDYAEVYWERMNDMQLEFGALDPLEYSLRFSAFAPGVSSAILGTGSLEHLEAAVQAVEKGPLPQGEVALIRARFEALGADWDGQV